jgi:hypothetical protein
MIGQEVLARLCWGDEGAGCSRTPLGCESNENRSALSVVAWAGASVRYRRAAEPNCIPGWKRSHPLKVTADGKLRLRRGQTVSHNPILIPPSATALSLELELVAAKKELDRDGEVRISFRPCIGDELRLLATIPLADIRGGNCQVPLPQGVAGTAGMLHIAVTGDGPRSAVSVALDNVNFDATLAGPSDDESAAVPSVASAAAASLHE